MKGNGDDRGEGVIEGGIENEKKRERERKDKTSSRVVEMKDNCQFIK
jgi:hypothetical protein